MDLFGKKMVDIVHELLESYVHDGDLCIDATMGTGADTLKLCSCVGEDGLVYAFDIQSEALEQTAALLKQNHMEERARLILDSHDKIKNYVHENIQAFVLTSAIAKDKSKVIQKKTRPRRRLKCA